MGPTVPPQPPHSTRSHQAGARRFSEESYALAAKAKGYTPSGAAFPIEGVNNIVAGVRKIPGSKYVIYQGPQYVNG